MKLILTALFLYFTICLSWGQIKHDNPQFPKGNDATQRKALPYYNDACDHYAAGDLEGAKRSLKKAINISFALTEAQLFLGDIMYEQERFDSALYYYNSGIDFVIEQLPHYYFKLFESGMKCGNYDLVKHNLKHFKKLYGKHAFTRYEESYPYKRSDYEFYERCMKEVYDYNNWLPSARELDTLPDRQSFMALGAQWKTYAQGNSKNLKRKKRSSLEDLTFFKEKKSWLTKDEFKLLPDNAADFFLTESKSHLFYNVEEDNRTRLFVAEKRKGKWESIYALPESINEGKWTAQAYYNEETQLLYFSSEEEGNKDLFVAHYDVTTNTVESVNPLRRINTKGDEMAPYFHDGIFYFSSNGIEGFGGFDIFQTHNNEIINGILYPTNYYSLGHSFSTHHDETKININDNNEILLKREHRFGPVNYLFLKKIPQAKPMYMELHVEPVN